MNIGTLWAVDDQPADKEELAVISSVDMEYPTVLQMAIELRYQDHN